MHEAAPAKVNLTLAIKGRLANGYHAIESLIAFASVADRLTVMTPDSDQTIVGQLDGPFGVALNSDGLVAKAAGSIARHHAGLERLRGHDVGLRLPMVRLTKRLPVAAGLGGGSADAAAYLRLVQRLNPDVVPLLDWARIALELGADVPACLASRPVVASGMGEHLSPIRFAQALPAVLVNPMVEVPATKTRDVFRELQAGPVALDHRPAAIRYEWASLAARIHAGANDLTDAAVSVMPVIEEVLGRVGTVEGCRLARLSGAGPTVFGLFDDFASARSAARVLAAERPDWWVRPVSLGPPTCPA